MSTRLEVADIFRRYGEAYRQAHDKRCRADGTLAAPCFGILLCRCVRKYDHWPGNFHGCRRTHWRTARVPNSSALCTVECSAPRVQAKILHSGLGPLLDRLAQ
ncbi:MAG: hypothetical protein E5X52_35355 [Mesorhizobium sp.]|nr:MAG: hypothetical protein E5X52_35355 [Mesorhizobium sp.]